MNNKKTIYLVIGAVVFLSCVVFGLSSSKNQLEKQILPSPTPIVEQKTTNNTSSWIVYANTTFGYSLKFPATYQVPPQTQKEISQIGIDNNIGVEKKSDLTGNNLIVIDVNINKDNLSLDDYMNQNLKLYGISGPLISYKFNGYDSLFNKNQPGTDVFVKQDQYIYHVSAPTASSDKEIGSIVATFKFTPILDN